jgi:hypothetical protein
VIGVAIHDGDSLEYAEGVRIDFGAQGYPNAMIDRKLFDGETKELHIRSEWTGNVAEQLVKYTPVEVGVSHTYDPSTRTITATITADYVDYAAGDMRFVLEITEDNVTGVGTGYDQSNYSNTDTGHPL